LLSTYYAKLISFGARVGARFGTAGKPSIDAVSLSAYPAHSPAVPEKLLADLLLRDTPPHDSPEMAVGSKVRMSRRIGDAPAGLDDVLSGIAESRA